MEKEAQTGAVCPGCGEPVPAGGGICLNCGRALAAAPETTRPEPANPPQGYPNQNGSGPARPPQNPGYPPRYPVYPPQQYPVYPPRYPNYPPQQYPPQNPGYPPRYPAYPPQQYPGYPPQYPGYPPRYPAYPAQPWGYPPQNAGQPRPPVTPPNGVTLPVKQPEVPAQAQTSEPEQKTEATPVDTPTEKPTVVAPAETPAEASPKTVPPRQYPAPGQPPCQGCPYYPRNPGYPPYPPYTYQGYGAGPYGGWTPPPNQPEPEPAVSIQTFRRKHAPQLRTRIRVIAIIGYLLAALYNLIALVYEPVMLGYFLPLAAVTLAMHVGKSKPCAVALLSYAGVGLLISPAFFLPWLVLGILAVVFFQQADQQYIPFLRSLS